jgi:hypothetical protein
MNKEKFQNNKSNKNVIIDKITDFEEDDYPKNIKTKPYLKGTEQVMSRIINHKRIYNIR